MDRTEAADRAESTPRWRSLLDRARLANRLGADEIEDQPPPDDPRREPGGRRAHGGGRPGGSTSMFEPAGGDVRGRGPARDNGRGHDGWPHEPSGGSGHNPADAAPVRPPAPRRHGGGDAGVYGAPVSGGPPGVYGAPVSGGGYADQAPSAAEPALGPARGRAVGRGTPPAPDPQASNGAYLGAGAGYVPAPPVQPATSAPPAYGTAATPRPVGSPRIGTPPQQGRGHSRLAGRVEWQAPPSNAGVDQIVAAVRRDLGGPKVFAFANPKGGVHKTTATVLAAATIGGIRGRGVLAWDDNELRGTLGLRAGSARHARTIRHLVNDIDEIESYHGAELTGRLDNYLRHAYDGSYDVLAGEENPRFARKLDPATVRRVLELLRRTHEVICVDTGNNVESSNWQTILQMADQLVITTVPREDAAFTADWMLDLLYDTGLGDLVANAVTLLSCPTPNPSALLQDLAAHFATRTRAVAVVPYDPMLESGSSIDHTQLAPATRRAWLQAAGVMVEPFVR